MGPEHGWNLADVWEIAAAVVPDRIAQGQGARTTTWREYDQRAEALATDFLEAGLGRQSKVAAYLYSCPEYMEVYYAALKGAFVPLNVNYRYGPEEVRYILDDADADAVVFHATFTPTLEEIRSRLPKVRRWYVVADGEAAPEWAVPYEDVASRTGARLETPWSRSGDDLILLYTGGTTGMPKGVMWEQNELFQVIGGGGDLIRANGPVETLDELRKRFESQVDEPPYTVLPACPLMHGTGQFSAFIAFNAAGTVVTQEGRHFDPAELWRTIDRFGVSAVAIVGDAFARPLLADLELHRGDYDLSSLRLLVSSGVMWSHATKEGLLRHLPNVIVLDTLGSSEAVGMGASVSSTGNAAETAEFRLGTGVRVLGPDDRDVEPGSDVPGLVAVPGHVPLGYYKDPEKSAQTFRTIDGVRYSVPGDLALVRADGTIELLGRSSAVINTGGEKVFAEEVEEAIKLVPGVRDAVCVGVPDERFGQAVTAVVELDPGTQLELAALRGFVSERLAAYKAPRHLLVVESIARSPSGKVDYGQLRALAEANASGGG